MLYLHVSNRTENLLLHLAEVIRSAGRRSPFEKEYFLIQSQGMERIISQTMARRFTSWCHFEFMLPVQFLTFCAEKLGVEQEHSSYEREVLLWRLEGLLRQVDGDVYNPIRSYVEGGDGSLKRFQLASQLANLFDQYQLMRPEMIAAWQEGRTVTGDGNEPWQMDLWRRLVRQTKECRHRGELLSSVVRELQSVPPRTSSLPERVNVFGLSTMVPLFLDFLQAVAVNSQVHLYVLSPCRHYWGDMLARRSEPEASEHHPLLAALGQQGRDFQKLLYDGVTYEQDFSSYQDPSEEGNVTLLTRLQSGLLEGRIDHGGDGHASSPDDSLHIVSCHSKIRELNVLKDHILNWLYEDPGLELRDIVVMAPDIQEYSSLIPALFSDIQHSIADRSLHKRNDVVSAFSGFLNLLTGRFGWDEVLELLKEPAVSTRLFLSETDLADIRKWVVDSGVRWGLSGPWKKESGLAEFEESTWKSGLERMLMGYAIDGEEFIDGVLPYGEIEGRGGEVLGRLCRFMEMVEQAVAEFQIERELYDWSRLLAGYCEQLFGDGSREYLDLQEILASLEEISEEYHQGGVEFRVIRAWLDRVTKEVRSSSGFLRGQLTFCSMLPMRSIPFQHVCLIGMNEGAFPRNDRTATFDLMGNRYRPGDRSKRMDDRYQFLEALLSARQKLYISYVGQSVRTNESIPPSVVVAELVDVLNGYYGVKEPIIAHPLQPYSLQYYGGADQALFSYDENCCRVAVNLQKPSEPLEPWWNGYRKADIREVGWPDLRRFYRHPQQWFLRDCLGIRIRDEFEVVPESETFSHDSLQSYLIDQDVLAGIQDGCDARQILKELQVKGQWPLGKGGELQFNERYTKLTEFREAMDSLQPGPVVPDLQIDLVVDGVAVQGILGNLYEEGIFIFRHARLKAADYLNGWLHSLIFTRVSGKRLPVILAGREGQVVRFEADIPQEPGLERLVAIFVDGCREPSRLYPEFGFAGLDYFYKDKSLVEGALKSLTRSFTNGYDPELEFLLAGAGHNAIFNEEFEQLCHEVLKPLWRAGL